MDDSRPGMASDGAVTVEVNRKDFRETRTVENPPVELLAGQVRLVVERFAMTTNNISYAVAGDMLDYWGFFPAAAPWGRIPVMGLGSVVESVHPDIAVGGRYFGFFPMSTELVIDAKPSGGGFRDVGLHRAEHAATYTGFREVSTDEMFREEKADEYLILWGMFMTSFLVDDYLADHQDENGAMFYGTEQTLVTSASSKTSISLASCLARRAGQRSVGVTSERNRAFVNDLDLYDQVITYDEIDQLDATVTTGVVDMAGNSAVRAAIHTHFADNLRFSLTVGATHWEAAEPNTERLPGPKPEFFFAPGQSAKRTEEWGATELASRIAGAFHQLLDHTESWLNVTHHTGPDGVTDVYHQLLEGQADPSVGFVVSVSPE